uniref:NADP-dependent oxidoreductase domain-containing protein n=1 Tax=Corethron hystrix TaxID=216773 RepID=A0A7S1G2R5_9STRA
MAGTAASYGRLGTGAATALSSSAADSSSCANTSMPALGLGTFLIIRERISAALRSAVLGPGNYRRIDCAPVYFNEDAIGDALRDEIYGRMPHDGGGGGETKPLSREDLFLVSKLPGVYMRPEHVEAALRKTLSDLRTDYLDLYLIHWPAPMRHVPFPPDGYRGWPDEAIDDSGDGENLVYDVSVHDTWAAMEDLVASGLVRRIGVSNFPVALLHELATRSRVLPFVNQVEIHPYHAQEGLVRYCRARGIAVQAYSPLGTRGYASMEGAEEPHVLEDPALVGIAVERGVSPAQVALAWAIRRGMTAVAKSEDPSRQAENMAACRRGEGSLVESLTAEEITAISGLDRGHRFFRPEEWWGDSAYAVFN